MSIRTFPVYENDDEIAYIDRLMIQNGIQEVRMSGEIKFSKNQEGLTRAFALKRVVDSIIEEMKRDKNFPYRV